jgi:hypothetical protein
MRHSARVQIDKHVHHRLPSCREAVAVDVIPAPPRLREFWLSNGRHSTKSSRSALLTAPSKLVGPAKPGVAWRGSLDLTCRVDYGTRPYLRRERFLRRWQRKPSQCLAWPGMPTPAECRAAGREAGPRPCSCCRPRAPSRPELFLAGGSEHVTGAKRSLAK